ncbi:substrate-binding periplasmic protein [Candidatus Bipolaricaulota bacterium]
MATRRKNLLSISLALVLMVTMCSMAFADSMIDRVIRDGVLKVGWASWHPYAFLDADTGEPTGLSIELVTNLASELGVELELVEDSWGTFIAGLQGGKFDIWMNCSITLARALQIGYTDGITIHPGSFVVTKSWRAEHPEVESIWDMDSSDYSVFVTLGSNTAGNLKANFSDINIIELEKSPEMITGIFADRADAAVYDYAGGYFVVQDRPDELEILPGFLPANEVGFAIPRDDYFSLYWLNLWITKVVRERVVQDLMDKYGMPPGMLLGGE